MKIDVIGELAAGRMSLDDVERTYDAIMDSDSPHVEEQLGMSRLEWTAFGHGVWFDELARWRKEGWPVSCAVCGNPISIHNFGWFARKSNGTHELVHIACL